MSPKSPGYARHGWGRVSETDLVQGMVQEVACHLMARFASHQMVTDSPSDLLGTRAAAELLHDPRAVLGAAFLAFLALLARRDAGRIAGGRFVPSLERRK